MDSTDLAPRRIKTALLAIPGARSLLSARRERRFRSTFAQCRGVYASFDAALRAAPGTKPTGFDVPGMEELFRGRADKVHTYDYPVMFWLDRLLGPGARVLDVGGNVGIHYFGYSRHLVYLPDLVWTVAEVPRVAAAGELMARERHASCLRFVTDWSEHEGANILLSSGALQYIERPLEEWLAARLRRPEHLLLNKLPLGEDDTFVTLQNAGVSFTPMRVLNRGRFLERLSALGYELVDAWENTDYPGCWVVDHPEQTVRALSGLYLRQVTVH